MASKDHEAVGLAGALDGAPYEYSRSFLDLDFKKSIENAHSIVQGNDTGKQDIRAIPQPIADKNDENMLD